MRTFFFSSLAAALFFAGCTTPATKPVGFTPTELSERTAGLRAPYAPDPTSSFERIDGVDPYTQPPTVRPGSDIVMGESYASRKVATNFQRAGGNIPSADVVLHYTGEAGARALPASHRLPRGADDARADVGGGYVALNVKERFQGPLPLISAGGKNYVVIKEGREHFFAIHNALRQPVEVVISINGQALVDGQAASYRRRGYVIDPGTSVSVAAPLGTSSGEITMGVFTGVEGH